MTEMEFDAAYFERFYGAPGTRVHDAREIGHLARGVTEMIAWLGGEIASVLDVGAGPGLWRDWFRRHKPRASYRSIDVSPYACARFGHEQRDISRWRAPEKFDLIVCQGVLPYLEDDACASAIDNIGAMADGFFYLEAPTAKDIRETCDPEKTDPALRPRPGRWYKERLARHFFPLGLGLHYVKNGPLHFYELERG
jgi:Methyltransferase domain